MGNNPVDSLTCEYALRLDQQDPLGSFRKAFVISDPDLIYLDGNSLGRLHKGVIPRMHEAIEAEWGTDLIRAWNKGWWDAPVRLGEQIAPLLGAAPGQVIVGDQTSMNLFKLAAAALALQPDKRRIITDSFNFPSDLYILQGIVQLLGRRHEIIRIGSRDDDITPDLSALESAIDDDTALVTLSHVTFKSGYLYDMKHVTELAHRKGAIVLWDLSHSAGALPIQLDDCHVDFAIGCTYKYLNGGPGAPAFMYINKSCQDRAVSPIWGWWGQTQPFSFDLDYRPAQGLQRFLVGTAPVLSMTALEAGLAPMLEAGTQRLRQKSVGLTQLAIDLCDSMLAPMGFTLGSPPRGQRTRLSCEHPPSGRLPHQPRID